MSWNDFSTAEQQSEPSYGPIPRGTPIKVILKVRPGGASFEGCPDGLATRSDKGGAIYLDCEYTVVGGKYNKRKIWSMLGLHSPKGPTWENMGRAMVRAMLESARGVSPDDISETAMSARRIKDLGDLNGLEFAAFADVEKSEGYDPKNVIKNVLPKGHKDYAAVMAGEAPTGASAGAMGQTTQKSSSAATPSWAQ